MHTGLVRFTPYREGQQTLVAFLLEKKNKRNINNCSRKLKSGADMSIVRINILIYYHSTTSSIRSAALFASGSSSSTRTTASPQGNKEPYDEKDHIRNKIQAHDFQENELYLGKKEQIKHERLQQFIMSLRNVLANFLFSYFSYFRIIINF